MAGDLRSLDGHEVVGHFDIQRLADVGVEHLGEHGRVGDLHRGDVGAVDQDLKGHLGGLCADIVVVDGQRRHAAAGAEPGLAGDDGDAGGQGYVVDRLGAGGGGVVGGDVKHVALAHGAGGDGGDVVGVGELKVLHGLAEGLEQRGDGLDLEAGVGLGVAEEDAHGLGVGEEVVQHGGLPVERGQVGRAGDVERDAAAFPLVDSRWM